MSTTNSLEQPCPRPLSAAAVERLPSARIPSRAALVGNHAGGVATTSLFEQMQNRSPSQRGQ